ncbi:uncharacterized protein LOC107043528 [Diachasma alloeum]|uniref:uncharacterized protein LOC107043528 n=1 Tax=Diachasma alloeum TaxID=454923 RepID=UPI0007382AD3|nr:uncharacterized protein LOC107043528 [Diachasma alloeum]
MPVVTYTHTDDAAHAASSAHPQKTRSSVYITGVGGSSSGTTTGEVHLTLQSIHSEERIEVTAHSLERLTSTLPSFSAEGLKWDHIEGLELADPHFRVSAPIDLLVGADVFGQVIKPNVIRGGVQAPVAQLTSFGWIVYGPAGPDQPTSCSSHHLSVSNDELNDLLTKFWVQEEVPGRTDANLSTEELECERHFRQTHSRDSSGRYVVRLPFSAPVSSLGNSYRPALACLHRMLARISKDERFLQLYSGFLKEYEDLDHMRLVTRSTHRSSSSVQADSACRSDETTLAHEAQTSGELRVSEGLQVGPSDAQRSYYLPHHGVVRESSETTKLRVVFNGSAKTSSGNSLNDILHIGAKLQRDISDVLLWSRQHKVIFMTDITKMVKKFVISALLEECLWQNGIPSSDNFVFSSQTSDESKVSKRNILSEIAQIYDQLRFLSPVMIRRKLLMQETWIGKLGWDEEVPEQVAQRWKSFRNDLTLLSKLSVPRCLGLLQNSSIEIHGFSDASVLAMSAVVYLKIVNGDEESRISLVCAKTKVAPLKRLTIPRLELTAAVMLAKLVKYVKGELNLSNAPTFLWTDSSVALTWINSHPSRWKEFVRNRVQLIQETSRAQWKLVPGKENPADCASRGLTTAQLSAHELWWHGPPWLMKSSSSWPSLELASVTSADLEEKPGVVLSIALNYGHLPWRGPPWLMKSSSSWPSLELASVTSADLEEKPGVVLNVKVQRIEIWDLVHRYSSLNRLLRITAICQRVIARLRRITGSSLATALNPGDIEQARLLWVKLTQSAHFSAELTTLSRGQRLSSSHSLTRLTAFLDHRGVLRVGGRLKFAQLDCENKHQIILPRDSQFAQHIIRDVQKNYWIIVSNSSEPW